MRGDAGGRREHKDKWITVAGNGKTKNLLSPKPKPKLHNAFAILSQPNAPTYNDAPSPAQQMDDNRTIIPPGPREHCRQQKLPGASISNKHYCGYIKVMICSSTTASPMTRTNTLPLPRATPTMQGMWQLIPPMHNVANQPLGSPNMATIWPTTWIPHSMGLKKAKQEQICQFCQAEQGTSIRCHFNP